MESKKKALNNFVQKKWRPQDYFGSFEVNESIPKGLIQQPNQNDVRFSSPQYNLSDDDHETIRQLGLSLSPSGEPILDDADENLLYESIDNPENMSTRGKYLYDLMVKKDEDEIRDPELSRKWQERHAR